MNCARQGVMPPVSEDRIKTDVTGVWKQTFLKKLVLLHQEERNADEDLRSL